VLACPLVGYRENLYDVFLFLHIVASIVGFGAVFLNGLYDAKAKKLGGAGGQAVAETNFAVSNIAEYLIYSVPVWGFAMIGVSDDAISFGETWVWLSLVLYVIGLGISHGVVRAGAKKLMEHRTEDVEKRVAMGGAALNLLLLVIIGLMIFKPGSDLL
jgi:uncharacterized membrane protein